MNFKNLSVIATFFGLWLSNFFEAPSQKILAFVLIFSVGILHGSNDLSIISKMQGVSKSKQNLLFFASYILTVIVAAVLFYFTPVLALIGFIVFSAFHFGEQHWHSRMKENSPWSMLFMFNYGLFVLCLLFALNTSDTLAVISELSGIRLKEKIFIWGASITGALFLLGLIWLTFKKMLTINDLLFESFLVLVFAIVFGVASLIWAFAIYFIFWHSIPSMHEQIGFLYGKHSIRSLWSYIRASFLTWSISIAGIFILYFLVRDDEDLFLPIFFSFLGAITFAHAFIMNRMFIKDKK